MSGLWCATERGQVGGPPQKHSHCRGDPGIDIISHRLGICQQGPLLSNLPMFFTNYFYSSVDLQTNFLEAVFARKCFVDVHSLQIT